LIKIGSKFAWLWVAIEDPINKQVIHIDISFGRTMLIVAARFIASLINKFGKHPFQQHTMVYGIRNPVIF